MKSILNLLAAAIVIAALSSQPIAAAPAASTVIPPSQVDTYKSYVEYLAADEREGRGLGTKGIEQAAAWIETQLKQAGLQPAFGKSYRQPFKVKTGVEKTGTNSVEGLTEGDWTPLGFSSSGKFSGELAFVGYGIDAAPIGYEEMKGLDLKGKIVLMLRYEPQERDEFSPFDGKKPSRWSAIRYKTMQARERGAAAVIFVTGPLQDEDKDKLPVLRNDGPESPAGLPVFQVKTSVAQKWLAAAGIDLKKFQHDVDIDLKPRSNANTGVKITGDVSLRNTFANSENVAGILPGKGKSASEYVVIGAHYDHLGFGGERSMRPNEKAVHNGADDNASGTAAVVLAASRVKKIVEGSKDHRAVIFALFSGEEVGIAGSGAFMEKPPVPAKSMVAMINLDMVGAMKNDEFTALGSDSAPEWKVAIDSLGKGLNLKPTTGGDGYGPSDQTSFYAAGVPVVHFFTGTHDRYHTPDDKVAFINFDGGARIAELTAELAGEIATGVVTPKYASLSAAPSMQGDSRGYGAYLGTVPDSKAMGAMSGGVLLADTRKSGPADLAGIKGGDTIVKIAGTKIDNLYDMTYALQDSKPGETVDVVVIRDGKETTLRATLGERGARGGQPGQKPAAQPGAPAMPPPAVPAMPPQPGAAPAPPQPPAAPAPPAMPGMPPQAATPAAKPAGAFELPEVYKNHPGKDFVVNAGKPFDKSWPEEKHLKDVRQLTFGGENAEAYFSPDGTKLIYQWTRPEGGCDQQYVLDLATGDRKLVSTGKGRTTCGYYDWPAGDKIIYASTEAGSPDCPTPPDRSKGYVWGVFDTYDLWEANADGSNPRRLTTTVGYDAEATWCHRGGKFVFTSVRDGDLDLYQMDEAGNVKRLTNTPGYDGGAFYNANCTEIVWRASRPTGTDLETYQTLLKQGLVKPSKMELWVMNADGSNQRQITHTDAANFGPYFHPDGKRIIYSSNYQTGSVGFMPEFEVFLIDKDSGERERITYAPGFDGFPIFSPDGNWLVWGSNRAKEGGTETNIFIAKWVE